MHVVLHSSQYDQLTVDTIFLDSRYLDEETETVYSSAYLKIWISAAFPRQERAIQSQASSDEEKASRGIFSGSGAVGSIHPSI